MEQEKKLYRSRKNKVLCGVCGGFADYFDIDVTLIRIIVVLMSLFTCFFGLIPYLIVALIMPKEPISEETAESKAENAEENK